MIRRCGLTFALPSGDFGVTLEAESTGEYEPVTTTLLKNTLHKGMTFIDIGAHVGLFTLPASLWVGTEGRIVAFEPHPDNFNMLLQNISSNELPCTIEAIQSAVSDKNEKMQLHLSPFNTGDHQLFHKGGRHSVEVDCTTLDEFITNEQRVDVIKMDVQGAEAAVFRGMKRVLHDNPNIQIIWELSPAQLEVSGSSAKELLEWLQEEGFTFTVIDDATGVVEKATLDEVLEQCPNDSYLNVLCARDNEL